MNWAVRIAPRGEPGKRGLPLAALALLLALVMRLHAEIPDWRWNLGCPVRLWLVTGNFVRPAARRSASLVLVTESLARRFSRLPVQGGPTGGAARL